MDTQRLLNALMRKLNLQDTKELGTALGERCQLARLGAQRYYRRKDGAGHREGHANERAKRAH